MGGKAQGGFLVTTSGFSFVRFTLTPTSSYVGVWVHTCGPHTGSGEGITTSHRLFQEDGALDQLSQGWLNLSVFSRKEGQQCGSDYTKPTSPFSSKSLPDVWMASLRHPLLFQTSTKIQFCYDRLES